MHLHPLTRVVTQCYTRSTGFGCEETSAQCTSTAPMRKPPPSHEREHARHFSGCSHARVLDGSVAPLSTVERARACIHAAAFGLEGSALTHTSKNADKRSRRAYMSQDARQRNYALTLEKTVLFCLDISAVRKVNRNTEKKVDSGPICPQGADFLRRHKRKRKKESRMGQRLGRTFLFSSKKPFQCFSRVSTGGGQNGPVIFPTRNKEKGGRKAQWNVRNNTEKKKEKKKIHSAVAV